MLCRAFSLSTSSYYRWLQNPISKRQKEDIVLSKEINHSFKQSRSTYDSPRIQRVLKNEGKNHGQARIRRLMKESGLIAARRFKVTTNSNHNNPVTSNILGQQFKPIKPNVAWASDITYIKTNEGWLYLATVIELYNRKIIGWSMSTRLQTGLIVDALSMAIINTRPPQGVLLHFDRGSQYCSNVYQNLISKHGFICSMSGKGNCYDNAVMESFYHTLKVELIYGHRYQTRDEAQLAIFNYIEVFYNKVRLHSRLDYQTPDAFELAA